MTKAKIEQLLQEQFHPAYLNVIDDSHMHIGHEGAKQGGHFTVEIQAEVFKGKKLIESHRMVYAALEPIKTSIHALAIKIK
jgi:BolA protein